MADHTPIEHLVAQLTEDIRPLLDGRGAPVQGAVLADLLAIWLAGHIVISDPLATKALREELLAAHVNAVWQLVDLAAPALVGHSAFPA